MPDVQTPPRFDEFIASKSVSTRGVKPSNVWGAARRGHKHQGQDFGGPMDSDVGSADDGEVVFAGPNGNMGNAVKVKHLDGTVSVYGHLDKINVQRGDRVKAGANIGLLGRTGNAKGPHVHFELYQNDLPIDSAGTKYRPQIGAQRQPPPRFDEFINQSTQESGSTQEPLDELTRSVTRMTRRLERKPKGQPVAAASLVPGMGAIRQARQPHPQQPTLADIKRAEEQPEAGSGTIPRGVDPRLLKGEQPEDPMAYVRAQELATRVQPKRTETHLSPMPASMSARSPGLLERVGETIKEYAPGIANLDTPAGIKTDFPRGVLNAATLGAVPTREIGREERLINPQAEADAALASGVGQIAGSLIPFTLAGKIAAPLNAPRAIKTAVQFGLVDAGHQIVNSLKGQEVDWTSPIISTGLGAVIGKLEGANPGMVRRAIAFVAPQLALDAAKGVPAEQATQNALTNLGFALSAGGKQRGENAKVEAQPERVVESSGQARVPAGNEASVEAAPAVRIPPVAESAAPAEGSAAKPELIRHVDLQPRRVRNTATGSAGQFKKESTKAQAEERRAQVSPEPATEPQAPSVEAATTRASTAIPPAFGRRDPAFEQVKESYADVQPETVKGEGKLTDRIDRLPNVEKTYYDGNQRKLTVYYDETVPKQQVHIGVVKALQDARLHDSIKTITLISTEKGTFAPAPSSEKVKLLRELEGGKRRERGGVDVDLLTLGVRPFAKDIASRGREAVAGTREISDGIKSLLAPPSRGEAAQQTSRIVRANAAQMQRAHDIADKSLEGARKYFASQQPQANYDFIDRMERGQKQADIKTQAFADTFRQMLDERRDQIRALGTGKLENFIEDYFPHVWKDPKKAKDAFAGVASKRPFEGPKSFLKKRTLPLTSDGLALGLEPASNNPVDLAVLKLREMDKYLMAHQIMKEMKGQGNLKFFKVSERLPDGWTQIDDRVATVFSRGEKGELILRGRYAAPEPAAKIVNNYLSPGLNATMFRVPFKAWRATSNFLNQFQLGFSAFHAGFTTVDAVVSRMAVGLEDIANRRGFRRLEGLKTIASTPISPVTNLIQGNRMLREWYRPGSQGTEIGRLVNAMESGGGRARMDQFYSNNAVQKFTDTIRQGNIIGAALRGPGAAVELVAKPTMEWLVPRQKMGIFADLAKRELERLGPNATEAQIRHGMAKAWDSVDNRMGQLVYDNLFWNKTLKDLSMASVRSVGWNLGTLREVGGGLYDFANVLNRGTARLAGKKGDPLFTHRMAYTAALPLVVGTMGAMTQYLLTGKGPEELKDYFFPKTGALDENGNPERISFPSYMKDVFHAIEEPGKVITNKLHPLIGLMSEMLRNEDYYGTKIRNEDDPFVQQLKDVALHVGQSALPFAIRGYQKETERGGSLTKRALPFVGITPAPSYINKSPAEKVISEKVQASLPRGARTREEADRSRLRHDLQSKARKGQDISSEVQFAIKQGKLKPTDANDILRDAKQSPLQLRFKRLSLKDALEVWDVMSADERKDVREIIADKAASVDDLPETEQSAIRQKLDVIGLRKVSDLPETQRGEVLKRRQVLRRDAVRAQRDREIEDRKAGKKPRRDLGYAFPQ